MRFVDTNILLYAAIALPAYWDSAILAAARVMGCDAVYSEDMSAGEDHDGLRVIDSFAGRGGGP